MSSKWLFFTAGLGSSNFKAAAKRLASQAESFHVFSKIKVFEEAEVLECCPRLLDWYSKEDLANIKGYGWYSWKSKLADLVIREELLGEFDGYFYLDAGCEMYNSVLSRGRLFRYLEHAQKYNATLFSIPTPEFWFTKRKVLEAFSGWESHALTPQLQSGSWFFGNSVTSKNVVKLWDSIASKGPFMTDESLSEPCEFPGFKVHRYDQSIFSMACKTLNLTSLKETPPGSNTSLSYYVRALSYPFWWSRNRTGLSSIPPTLQLFSKVLPARVND
jgi:hypothetical protein